MRIFLIATIAVAIVGLAFVSAAVPPLRSAAIVSTGVTPLSFM